MSSDPFGFTPQAQGRRPAIRVDDVSKHYVMFERPEDRFKQMVVPRLQRLVGRPGRRYFRDFAALNGVSLEIGRGETVGIIGRNGSGKSTLLQIICGTLQPTSGSVEVNGRIAALLELGAGFNPEFTGRENVFLNAQILGVPRQEMEWRFDDIARFADIGPFLDQPVKTYSSGMYVRLAFATAINVDPDILVVDEALSVGDEAFQRKCFARIEDIKDKGGTILFVSHGAQTIVQLCTRAILIDGGEKLIEGNPKRVISQYQRLVGSSGADTAIIREEVREIGMNGPLLELPLAAAYEQAATERSSEIDNDDLPPEENDKPIFEGYDNNIHTNCVAYVSQGAHILDVTILNSKNERVNVLEPGRDYYFQYEVVFERSLRNVGFGMGIMTLTGVSLGGANTFDLRNYQIDVEAATTHRASFAFKCRLLEGSYVFNCGVIATVDDERKYVHRIMDAYLVRVREPQETVAGGMVDFGIAITVQERSGASQ